MCCSINNGHNTCPPNTFPGGWWKADRSSYCGGAARYYIDCNAKPGVALRAATATPAAATTGWVACNVFRYGQCNTQIHGTTAVVCRQISCRPPWEVYPGHCGTSSATDNNTAEHNAPCLTTGNTFPALPTFPKAPATLGPATCCTAAHRLTSPDRHTTLRLRQARKPVRAQPARQDLAGAHARQGARRARQAAAQRRARRAQQARRQGVELALGARQRAGRVLRLLNDGSLVIYNHGHASGSTAHPGRP